MTDSRSTRLGGLLAAALIVGACGPGASTAPSTGPTQAASQAASTAPLSGTVTIDGSSTVYPITELVAEEFQKANTGVQVPVAFSGTGGGFKKFCVGETDINDASRPIKADDEGEGKACTTNAIEFIQLQIAIDGLTVVVNPANTFATCLTLAELKTIYGPDSPEDLKWSDVRAGFPDQPVERFMPGADSGTFDYFTETVNGEVDATINDGTYKPLSRPLFIYPDVNKAKSRPELKAFVDYYLANAKQFSSEVGYVALPDALLAEQVTKWAAAVGG